MGYKERGKPEYPKKTSRRKRENLQFIPCMASLAGFPTLANGGHVIMLYSRELFHSNFVLIPCIMHTLRINRGANPPKNFIGRGKHTR